MIREANFPDGVVVPTRGATDPPEWRKFFSFGGAIGRQVGIESLTAALEGGLPAGGLLNNLDNDYMSASISREFGEVVVMRAKMPSFPDTRAASPPGVGPSPLLVDLPEPRDHPAIRRLPR